MFAATEHFCTTERVENAASKSGLQSLDEGIPQNIVTSYSLKLTNVCEVEFPSLEKESLPMY